MLSSQPPLIRDASNPLRHGARHYVPVLQSEKGERDALANASEATWDRITPLVEVVGRKNQSGPLKPGTVSAWVKRVCESVGQHTCYVDLLRPKPNRRVAATPARPVLQHIYERCRAERLSFIPVAPIDGSQGHLEQVAFAIRSEMTGVALRFPVFRVLPEASDGFRGAVERTLERLDVAPENVDLLLDLEHLDGDQPADNIEPLLVELADMFNWRNLVLMGTSIPATLGCIPEGTVGSLPRREWALWRALAPVLGGRLSFGDYCVQHPKPPQEKTGPGMRANIRYTTDNGILVARGWGPVMRTGNGEYVRLCDKLVDGDRFAGESFSWGDKLIAQCARGEIAPGAQPMWRGAGTSHHLAFVANQIAQLPSAV